jgi:putative ABC transport system ATP-binding protein
MLDHERAAVRGREIGFVFQTPHLIPQRTALENVMLALAYGDAPRGTRHAQAAEALEQVGLGHRAHAHASTLSGGECQRVAVARALAGRPTVLLCDEPTGNLDSAAAAAILDLLDRLHGDGATVLVVTHEQAVAARAQRTVPIRSGSLVPGLAPAPVGPA